MNSWKEVVLTRYHNSVQYHLMPHFYFSDRSKQTLKSQKSMKFQFLNYVRAFNPYPWILEKNPKTGNWASVIFGKKIQRKFKKSDFGNWASVISGKKIQTFFMSIQSWFFWKEKFWELSKRHFWKKKSIGLKISVKLLNAVLIQH